MNWRLLALRIHCPGSLKRRGLAELWQRTARAFDRGALASRPQTYPAMLCAYAAYTRAQALASLQDGGDAGETGRRLHREARAMGDALRRRLHLRTKADLHAALRLFYRTLGIDLRVCHGDQVVVRGCLFSKYYPAPVCRLISAFDDGLMEGLSGGCRLRFTQRMTEGAGCCRAVIEQPGGGAAGNRG